MLLLRQMAGACPHDAWDLTVGRTNADTAVGDGDGHVPSHVGVTGSYPRAAVSFRAEQQDKAVPVPLSSVSG